jgi:1-acyl-sn-glycerol-3-phosphate acyltransferase
VFYELVKYLVARPAAHVVFHTRIHHTDRIPPIGPVILAGNHLGIGETFLLPALITRPVVFAAKAELFEGKGWHRFGGWFLRAVRQVPMDRTGGRASVSGLGSVETILATGGVVGIFPEGTRSPDGRLHRGHTGVARLALGEGAPVVPVGFRGTDFRHGGWLVSPWFEAPQIVIGEPLTFDAATRQAYLDAPDRAAARAVLRTATDQVMAAIQALTGQEYVDAYAARGKKVRRSGQATPPIEG